MPGSGEVNGKPVDIQTVQRLSDGTIFKCADYRGGIRLKNDPTIYFYLYNLFMAENGKVYGLVKNYKLSYDCPKRYKQIELSEIEEAIS